MEAGRPGLKFTAKDKEGALSKPLLAHFGTQQPVQTLPGERS